MTLKQAREAVSRDYNRDEFDNITDVWIGRKERGGKRTDEPCVVVKVKKKLPLFQVPEPQRIPEKIDDIPTDVIEGPIFKAGIVDPVIQTLPQSLVDRQRPCPGGYSCGHHQITAGTLGAWVHWSDKPDWYILSNNHVLGQSNEASPGDDIYQPGPHDGGRISDRIAVLSEYVRIRFEGEPEPPPDGGDGNGGKKKKELLKLAKAWKDLANSLAELLDCDTRAIFTTPHVIRQPYPNLVDAAIARAVTPEFVDPVIHSIGAVQGVVEAELGMGAQKTGRTTDHETGEVTGIDGDVRVDYGKGIARFQGQTIIEGDNGDFSAGGDSGSVITDKRGYAVALLFAGGGGRTIGNRMSDVVSLLGVRFT